LDSPSGFRDSELHNEGVFDGIRVVVLALANHGKTEFVIKFDRPAVGFSDFQNNTGGIAIL
jgi:hypothetical protein